MGSGRVACIVLFALAVAACTRNKESPPADDDAGLAEDGTESTSVESDAEILASALVAGRDTSGQVALASLPDLAEGPLGTRDIGDVARAVFLPKGCVTVTPDPGNTATAGSATYTFNGCFGPRGLTNVRGEVKATYATSPGRLAVDFVATDLQVNRATLDWSAHAELAATGNMRRMTWKAQIAGTTSRGREVARSNDKVVEWTVGEPCIAVAGTSEGNVRGRNLRIDVVGLRRCRGSCPDAGGQVVITDVDANRRIEIRFDGTNRAVVVGPRGGQSTLPLLCGG